MNLAQFFTRIRTRRNSGLKPVTSSHYLHTFHAMDLKSHDHGDFIIII